MLEHYFQKLYFGNDLNKQESREALQIIMDGAASPVQIAAFLVALHLKGETETEITAFAEIMREKSLGYDYQGNLLDTCGTGGDKKGIFNVSTAVAVTVSACGVAVAKHGNRAVSSSSGSADILRVLDVNIELDKNQAQQAIDATGLGFLFAQSFHPAMRHVAPVRKELGVRTVFNILGPLANPFRASSQLMGIFDGSLLDVIIKVLKNLQLQNAMVLHSRDGFDEISVFDKTDSFYFQDSGEIHSMILDPAEYGLQHEADKLPAIVAESMDKAEKIFLDALRGENVTARDMVAFNSGVALWLIKHSSSIAEGVEQSLQVIHDGIAGKKLQEYALFSQRFPRPLAQ